MDADASNENGAVSVVLALGGWLGDRLKASGIAVRDLGVTETGVLECQMAPRGHDTSFRVTKTGISKYQQPI